MGRKEEKVFQDQGGIHLETKHRIRITCFILTTILVVGCMEKSDPGVKNTDNKTETPMISVTKTYDVNGILLKDSAINIAILDSQIPKDKINNYVVTAIRKNDEWHVHIGLKDIYMKGGGISYIIDGRTGDLISKIMEQ